jgi:hypothetical protein
MNRSVAVALGIFLLYHSSANVFAQSAQSSAGTFIVSLDGNDANPGTLAAPFLTPARAQSAVQQALAEGVADPVVYFRGGTTLATRLRYFISSTLSFGPADSALSGHTVTWSSYPGEYAAISGGAPITGWTPCTTADAVCKSGSGGVYQASVTSPSDFREAYFGDVHGTRVAGAINPSGWSATSSGVFTAPVNSTTPTSSWKNIQQIELVFEDGYQHTFCKINTISGTTITPQDPCKTNWANAFYTQIFGRGTATPIWVENAYELLPTCGQGCWYYDIAARNLYYIPLTAQNMATLDVEVPAVSQLVTGWGANNIIFRELTFEHSTYTYPDIGGHGYVEMQNGYFCPNPASADCSNDNGTVGTPLPGALDFSAANSGIQLVHDAFTHLSPRPVFFEHGTQNCTVYANVFTDNAGGGVQIGDITDYAQSNPALQTSGCTVTDNQFDTTTAFEYRSGGAIFTPIAANTMITHNYSNGSYWAPVTIGWWGWNEGGEYHATYSANNTESENKTSFACIYYPMIDCGDFYVNGSQTNLNITGNYSTNEGGTTYQNGSASGNARLGGWYPDENSDATYSGNVIDSAAVGGPCDGSIFTSCTMLRGVPSSVANSVTVSGNYITSTSCYWENAGGLSLCSSQSGTGNLTWTGNTRFTKGSPPLAAQTIINNAGIEAGVVPGPSGTVVSPDGTILTTPSSGSLTTAAGTWTLGTAQQSGEPGQYQIFLNGSANKWPAGQGYAAKLEVANGGQLYTYNSYVNGWWVWSGTGWSQSSAPSGGGGISPDGTILTTPSTGSLTTAAGTWTLGTAQQSGEPGQYQIFLNGTASDWPAGQGYAAKLEVANGGQLYTYNSFVNGWWVWSGTGWSQSSAPSGGGGISPDGTILTAPSTGSLTTAAGTWTLGTAQQSGEPGQYQIFLNGTTSDWPAGQGYTAEMEVADGGQLYTYNSYVNGWWVWSGTGWTGVSGP